MKITIVRLYDWTGFYLDGVLKQEGHSIRHDVLIEELIKAGKVLKEFENIYINDEPWIEENIHCVGGLPNNLEDIPKRFR